MKPSIATLTFMLLICLSACDRYRVTFNERTISEPAELFNDFEVADNGLRTCLEQTIRDLKIRRPGELTRLTCSHAGITSVEGIEIFSSLTVLNLAENALASVSPLLFLGNLESVNLLGNSRLSCGEVNKLIDQLPTPSAVIVPEHCT